MIVVSILLAFALDAWWESRQRANETDALLMALLAEFDASVAEFDRVAQRNEEVIRAADEVISVLRNSSGSIRLDPALLGDLGEGESSSDDESGSG